MKRWLALGLGVLAVTTARADQVSIQVVVHQMTLQRTTSYPFSAVGPFVIYRGDKAVAGASCPESSNTEGKLTCTMTCDQKDAAPKSLRVVPPSKTARVTGFVAPPSLELALSGCTATPSVIDKFVYKDSQLIMRTLLTGNSQFHGIVQASGDSEFRFAKIETAIPEFQKAAGTKEGVAALVSLNQAFAALADKKVDTEPVTADLLSQYTVGIQNVMLLQALKQNNAPVPAKFKITADKADYYANLVLVEDALDKSVARSTKQNLFLNDVQALKRQSLDPAKSARLYRQAGVAVQ